jgi:dipeptidyl aminopeptidase/acylaminoacyl peptidase
MPTTTPYGAWASPISPSMLAGSQVSYWGMASDADDVYWGEFRPAEGGRIATMRHRSGTTEEIAQGFDARTLVHEYGGQSLAADGGRIVASAFGDQRLHRLDGAEPAPITPDPPVPRAWRYADVDISGDRLVAVREDHTGEGEATNELVMLPIDGSANPVVVAAGADFYAAPRISPGEDRIAWIQWDHPNMPWDHSALWVADLSADGIGDPHRVATTGESCVQPEWSPDGDLHVISDRSGWWNLHRVDGDDLIPLAPAQLEFGEPGWLFGFRTYGFLPDGRVVAKAAAAGQWDLYVIEDGGLRPIDLGGRRASSPWMAVSGGRVWTVQGGPADPLSVLAIDPDGGLDVVASAMDVTLDPRLVSHPEAIDYPTSDGATAHAFLYPPTNPDHRAPADELPPLIVMAHGGPTSQTQPVLNLHILFWTSRGFAVADVNYRGSTGYGREYRNALRGRWGDVDVVDCVRVAEHLGDIGRVDPERLAVRGGSAGGYVTLCAMTFHDTFGAGTSYCGVADIEALMGTTHKFEARYDESLIGPMPESRRLAHDRSPIHFADRVSCPALIIQGAEDPIVTPDQAEVFVDAMRTNGTPHAYLLIEGEDHFLAKSDTVVTTREAELSFYGQVFGFEPAGEIPRLVVENL